MIMLQTEQISTQEDRAESGVDPIRVAIVTLGCDKNTVDNEYLAGMVEGAGCELVRAGDNRAIDAAVVTTCGFIASAKEQSINTILELAERKRETGSPRKLFVAGCLSQRYGEEMMKEIPEIDGLVGVGQFKQITEMILRSRADEARVMEIAPKPTVDVYTHLKRKPLTNKPYAFLKVSDGCNHTCTFCAIPNMKGKLRSVEPEILVQEAKDLIAAGVKELCLVAQDLSDYGRDRWPGSGEGKMRLPQLLRQICAIPGDFWVRCLYYYPGNINDEFLEVMATEPKVIPYLEMPLQHLDEAVLRRMKRPFHEKNTFETIERIRKAVPGVTIRSTVIVGFPGETTDEYNTLLAGLKRIEFDRLGAFQYSVEEDTPAGEAKNQIPEKTKAQRWRMVMERQSKIADRKSRARIGEKTRVLVEAFDETSGLYVGRSPAEAPEVDGKVLVQSRTPLEIGQFVNVRINGATTYDVYAEPLPGQ